MAEDDRTLRWRLLRWGLSDDDDEEDDDDSSWLWQRFDKERKDVAVDDDDDDDDGGGGMVVIEYIFFVCALCKLKMKKRKKDFLGFFYSCFFLGFLCFVLIKNYIFIWNKKFLN